MKLQKPTGPAKYIVTFLIVTAAAGLQGLLWPIIRPAAFFLFYPAVLLAAFYGEAVFAVLLSAFIVQAFFISSHFSLRVIWPRDFARLAVFIISGFMIRKVTDTATQALQRAREEQDRAQRSEARIRSVLENALDAVVAMDHRGIITQWNSQAEKTFGFAGNEAVGRRMSETIIPQKYREAHERGMRHYLETGEGPFLNRRVEITGLRRSGEEFPIELTITPVQTSVGTHFYGFIRDISERIGLLSELKEAIRARDEFMSIASHELKTPVTSLKLQFQMAARQIESGDPRAFSSEMVIKRIQSSNRQIDRMSKLIEDMFDISRVTSGKLELDIQPHDLSELVNEVAECFSDQFVASGSTLEINVQSGITVPCDIYRLEQVLSNLLTNAIKYGAGRPTTITVTKETSTVHIAVQDQGAGISKENLERIFHRFERAVTTSGISGLGLGLYISKQIVEGHHGKIWAESELGKGSRFVVELPL